MDRRIKLVLSYDGSGYAGWQIQKNIRTVQGELESALDKLHRHPVGTIVAGRTDSGVHAAGQVCHFDTDSSIPSEKFREALNSLLPHDVRVLKSTEVSKKFHARKSAVRRSYRYYIRESDVRSPFYRNYCFSVKSIPDIADLNSCARQIVGMHDFTAFAAAGDPNPSKVREIFTSVFYADKGFIVYRIDGTAFLWKMIRSLVGTMLEVASLRSPGERMKEIIDSGDRELAGTTAPAKGLYFFKVDYE